ncbi:hypothetical protein BVX94_00365, partial [bacterium B17]
MRIAVASTGLGHIARGIEAWAKALAEGLYSYSQEGRKGREGLINLNSCDATDSNFPKDLDSERKIRTEGHEDSKGNIEVTLFAAGEIETDAELVVLPCLRRNDKLVRLWTKLAPGFTWRWGWKASYSIEQRSFAKMLIPHLKSGKYDVVHTQDSVLALELERARRQGKIKTPVILA